jgi:hypothetical protein
VHPPLDGIWGPGPLTPFEHAAVVDAAAGHDFFGDGEIVSNADDWSKNLIRARTEGRFATSVFSPGGVVVGDLTLVKRLPVGGWFLLDAAHG